MREEKVEARIDGTPPHKATGLLAHARMCPCRPLRRRGRAHRRDGRAPNHHFPHLTAKIMPRRSDLPTAHAATRASLALPQSPTGGRSQLIGLSHRAYAHRTTGRPRALLLACSFQRFSCCSRGLASRSHTGHEETGRICWWRKREPCQRVMATFSLYQIHSQCLQMSNSKC